VGDSSGLQWGYMMDTGDTVSPPIGRFVRTITADQKMGGRRPTSSGNPAWTKRRIGCFSRRSTSCCRPWTNLADQNDSQTTTSNQKQCNKQNLWMKRRIGCILASVDESYAFHAAARVAGRGRSVRTNLADQNDSQATTNGQKQHTKHHV
jgi:hypothetical protein